MRYSLDNALECLLKSEISNDLKSIIESCLNEIEYIIDNKSDIDYIQAYDMGEFVFLSIGGLIESTSEVNILEDIVVSLEQEPETWDLNAIQEMVNDLVNVYYLRRERDPVFINIETSFNKNMQCIYESYSHNVKNEEDDEDEINRLIQGYSIKNQTRLIYEKEYNMIQQFISEQRYPVTREEIKAKVEGASDYIINKVLLNRNILTFRGEYISAERLNITTKELSEINAVTNKVLSDCKVHHVEEIFLMMRRNNKDMLNKCMIFDSYRLFSIIEYYFSDKYKFDRPCICKKEANMRNRIDRLKDYIYEKDQILIEDIQDYAEDIYYSIPSIINLVNDCNDKFFLLNSYKLINVNALGLNYSMFTLILNKIKKELQHSNKIKPIVMLKCIDELPELQVKWSEWLLYSVINKWGYMTNLEVGLSSPRFKDSIPFVAIEGYMNANIMSNYIKILSQGYKNPFDARDDDDVWIDEIETDVFEMDEEEIVWD